MVFSSLICSKNLLDNEIIFPTISELKKLSGIFLKKSDKFEKKCEFFSSFNIRLK